MEHSTKLPKSKAFFRMPSVIPGFRLTLGFTVLYLAVIIILPMSGLLFVTAKLSFAEFFRIATEPRLMHAYKISILCSLIAAIINAFFGTILAWVLVRYKFFGKSILDALVDLPFALPTAVAGIALTTLYAENGIMGKFFSQFGIKIAFTPIGITIALIFVGIPFVVRTLQPVIEDMETEVEEAAANLGANRFQILKKIVFPHIAPALLAGFSMAFVRSLGEYGSVIFIAGNMPFVSELVPLIIMIKLEQYDYSAATTVAVVMLGFAFAFLLLTNYIQKWNFAKIYKK